MPSPGSIDPYTTRYVSLGSGPRERASRCGCNYRTSSANSSSCYTGLCKDPILVSHQRSKEAISWNDAPLVRMLMREPGANKPDKVSRRMPRRPFSATTCTQMDAHHHPRTPFDGLIAVKGRNLNCQSRPIGRKTSESTITDRVIQSVSEATSKEVSKISSFFSNDTPRYIPKPPCPSPAPSDHSHTASESSDSERDQSTSGPDYVTPTNLTASLSGKETNLLDSNKDWNTGIFRESGRHSNKVGSVLEQNFEIDCITNQLPRDRISESNFLCDQDDVFFEEKQCGVRESRMHFQCKVPTGISDSGISLAEEPESYTETEGETHHAENRTSGSETPTSVSEIRTQQLARRRPVSAYAAIGPSIKPKNIEFVNDKDISGANMILSDRTLETMLYMEYLHDKEKLNRQRREEASCSSPARVQETDQGVWKVNRSCASKHVKMPDEMQVSSKPPCARKMKNERPSSSKIRSRQKSDATQNTDHSPSNTQSPREKLASLSERRAKLARKIIRKADSSFNSKKQQQKQEVSLIWRSIAGIDNTSNKKITEKSIDSSTVKLAEDHETAEGKAGRQLTPKKLPNEQTEKDSWSKESVQNNNFVGRASKNSKDNNLEADFDRCVVIADETGEDPVLASNIKDKKILRPTSAVILRYKEMKGDKDKLNNHNMGQNLYGTPGSGKQRPKSAAVQRLVSRKSSFASSPAPKVTSAKNQEMMVKNSRNRKPTSGNSKSSSAAPKKSTVGSKSLKQRPFSAPIKNPQKTNSATVFDIGQEERKISQECQNVLDAFNKKGMKISMDTITRALMPPCETAVSYSKSNLPHSSRLLSKPFTWFSE